MSLLSATSELITVDDLEGPQVRRLNPSQEQACRDVIRWAREYLCRSHPDLGRKGAVCPFVMGSLLRRGFYLHVEEDPLPTVERVEALAREMGERFPDLPPTLAPDGQYKTVLMLFPNMASEHVDLLDEVQARLKPAFVDRGYMIGQFHDRPPANPGLWNAEFRPLVSEIPMLVIRHMVQSDLPFLVDDKLFAAAWFDRFGSQATDRQLMTLQKSGSTSASAAP